MTADFKSIIKLIGFKLELKMNVQTWRTQYNIIDEKHMIDAEFECTNMHVLKNEHK